MTDKTASEDESSASALSTQSASEDESDDPSTHSSEDESQDESFHKTVQLTFIDDVELIPLITATIKWLELCNNKNQITKAIATSDINQVIEEQNIIHIVVDYCFGCPTEQMFVDFVHSAYKTINISEFSDHYLSPVDHQRAFTDPAKKCLNTLKQQRNALIKFFKNGANIKYAYFGLETAVGTWYNWNIRLFIECANYGLKEIQSNTLIYNGTYEDECDFSWQDIEWWFKSGQSRE